MKIPSWVCVFGLWVSFQASAAEEERHDMRELCRSEVSGTLLTAFNDVDYMRGLIAESEKKVKDSKARLQILQGTYKSLHKDAGQAIPAFDLDEQVLALNFEMDTLREQIQEAEQLIVANRQEVLKREDFRKKFEALVDSVFKVVRRKDSPPGSYDFGLEYRHICGSYNMLCPLPLSHAAQLKKIAEKVSHPQWCVRYSQVLDQ